MRWLDSTSDSKDMSLSKLQDSEGQGSLECCSPWGHTESDTTEWLNKGVPTFWEHCINTNALLPDSSPKLPPQAKSNYNTLLGLSYFTFLHVAISPLLQQINISTLYNSMVFLRVFPWKALTYSISQHFSVYLFFKISIVTAKCGSVFLYIRK